MGNNPDVCSSGKGYPQIVLLPSSVGCSDDTKKQFGGSDGNRLSRLGYKKHLVFFLVLSLGLLTMGCQLPCWEDTEAAPGQDPHARPEASCQQSCEWATLDVGSPAPVQPSGGSCSSWFLGWNHRRDQSQKNPAKMFMNSLPEDCKIINVCYFKLMSFGVIC